jgi:hypothetical protein
MNIGLIVYSDTGNTLSVAERLKDKLKANCHTAGMVRLVAKAGYGPGRAFPGFKEIPSLDRYQGLVFAAPVNAFSLCLPMKTYLPTIGALDGRKTALLVTEHLPFAWMGGKQAIGWMRRACALKGADVRGFGIVNWSRQDRERRIDAAVNDIAGCFSA